MRLKVRHVRLKLAIIALQKSVIGLPGKSLWRVTFERGSFRISATRSIKKSVSESNFDVLFWPNGNLTHLVEPSISSCKHSKTKKHGDALHNRHLALVSTPRARRSTLQRAIFCSRSHTYPTLRCLRPQEVLTCAPEGLCWQRSGC